MRCGTDVEARGTRNGAQQVADVEGWDGAVYSHLEKQSEVDQIEMRLGGSISAASDWNMAMGGDA